MQHAHVGLSGQWFALREYVLAHMPLGMSQGSGCPTHAPSNPVRVPAGTNYDEKNPVYVDRCYHAGRPNWLWLLPSDAGQTSARPGSRTCMCPCCHMSSCRPVCACLWFLQFRGTGHLWLWLGADDDGRFADDGPISYRVWFPLILTRTIGVNLSVKANGQSRERLPERLTDGRAGQPFFLPSSSPVSSTARNAFCGMSTEPMDFMRFLPAFCFSHNLRLRLISPP